MKSLYLPALILFIAVSCKSESYVQKDIVPFFVKDALEKYEIKQIDFVPNEDKKFVLVINNPGENLPRAKNYTVYDAKGEKIIYENSFIEGNLEWFSKNEIVIKNSSRTEPNSKIIINILTGESRVN